MKLTKTKLKQLIKEELDALKEFRRELVQAPPVGAVPPEQPIGDLCTVCDNQEFISDLEKAFETARATDVKDAWTGDWAEYTQKFGQKGLFTIYRGFRSEADQPGDDRETVQFAVAPSLNNPVYFREISASDTIQDFGQCERGTEWLNTFYHKERFQRLIDAHVRAVDWVRHWMSDTDGVIKSRFRYNDVAKRCGKGGPITNITYAPARAKRRRRRRKKF